MSTLAEVLCGRVHPRWMSTFEAPCLSCDHLAAVVAEWLTSEQAAEVAARAHYVASEDDREWAAGAWDDMGGSEPTYERAAAVIAMREALTALAAHAKGETG